MSHYTSAVIAMTALVVLLTIGFFDYLAPPYMVPEGILKAVEAILIGVAIVLIVAGLKGNGE